MPEYLAPGVYVEEVSTGNRPIQAASTSTAAMVGMTARGPVARPTLVTSRAAYARLFGGPLDPRQYEHHDGLPYAAEGFFTNGGARLYVVRVVGGAAREARTSLLAQAGSALTQFRLATGARQGDTSVTVTGDDAPADDTNVLIGNGATSDVTTVDASQGKQPVVGHLEHAYAAATGVTVQTLTALAGSPTGAVAEGATQLDLGDVTGIAVAQVLVLDEGAAAEVVSVETIDVPAGSVMLHAPVRGDHAAGVPLSSMVDGAAKSLTSDVEASEGPVGLALDDVTNVEPGTVLKVADATNEEYAVVTGFHRTLTLADELAHDHDSDTLVTPAGARMTVHARWPGQWGNDVRVTVRPASILTTTTETAVGATDTFLTLGRVTGLTPGTVLAFEGGARATVAAIGPAPNRVRLAAPPSQTVSAGAAVSSQEFSLLVERVEGDKVVESETFDQLSIGTGHPRNALGIVGSWNTSEGRPSEHGQSLLVRLSEVNATAVLPFVPDVTRHLAGGDDDEAAVADTTYEGQASEDPGRRSGIQALENEPTISIVAVPGVTSVTVQQQLVAHCDKMRYRFAVLDVPPGATLAEAREHRQNFDTTRAALYYPDLVIADPFGAPGSRRDIPPSGHIAGVYARTDIARGVHKAPANEVVSGALALRVALTKGEQDILNPINLNCLRDFRTENRGIRVYGGRVASSDPEWRYVNVRRLLLFIEQSLDTGLQWAVFEPNDKPLWDGVKQSVTGFLDSVWRSGALAGTQQEDAFFVNIGYDVTMTQADIDNGLLIVEIGVAPVKPAEFVVVRIHQKTREATA